MSSAETARAQALAAARAQALDGASAAEREARAQALAAARARARAGDAGVALPARAVPHYAGLATRAVALAIDAAAINAVALGVGGVVALCTSLLHLPGTVEQIVAIAGAAAWLAWAAGWFVVFWSTTGQTPGDRVMRIHVRDARDPSRPIGHGRALVRLVALVLGAIPLFAGYLMVLVNDRRRAFHDVAAHTVVIHDGAPQPEPPAVFAPPLAPG